MKDRLARKISGEKLPTKKEQKPIPKMSAKRKEENKTLDKIRAKKLKENPYCTINSPICERVATGLDHIQKTSPKNRVKEENLTPACSPCNGYKEKFPLWAEANGKSISRFAK